MEHESSPRGGMLAVFRELRLKRKGKEEGEGGAEEKVDRAKPEEGMDRAKSAAAPSREAFKAAADRVDAIAGAPVEGARPGEGAQPGEDAAVVAKEAGVSPEDAQKLLDAAKKLDETRELEPVELGRRIRDDFDLRMRLEAIAARPGRLEHEEPAAMRLPGEEGAEEREEA